MEQAIDLISKYGFPCVAAYSMAYFVYFIWLWAINDIKPQINKADQKLIHLIDRLRMLDNDLIRLKEKVNTTLYIKHRMHQLEDNQKSEM